jgi:uncharacterized SAM-dependent methyltransferase
MQATQLNSDLYHVDPDMSALCRDALRLITFEATGHMGKWEYGPALHSDDPGAGADLWSKMVSTASDYYVSRSDAELVQWAISQECLKTRLKDTVNFIEFGPGSYKSVTEKTLPFLTLSEKTRTFTAVDMSRHFAYEAAWCATYGTLIKGTGLQADFTRPLVLRNEGQSCYFILGSTISNMPCPAGSNGFQDLVKFFSTVLSSMEQDDFFVCTFDSCSNLDLIMKAYNNLPARNHGINLAYRLKRDGILLGDYNPAQWQYEPVWFSDSSQICHTIYPLISQRARVAGFDIDIPAYRQYVTNNSYKYNPEFVSWAAVTAGFHDTQILTKGTASLIIARK